MYVEKHCNSQNKNNYSYKSKIVSVLNNPQGSDKFLKKNNTLERKKIEEDCIPPKCQVKVAGLFA